MIRRTRVALCAAVVTVLGSLVVAAPAYAAAPTITSFTPTSGPVATSVTLSGSGFTSASTVSFNGVKSTSVTYSSSTKLSAKVPTGATTGKITVTTTGGSVTSSSTFTVTPGIVLGITSGPPTTLSSLTGSAFGANEAADVYFDTTELSLVTTTGAGAISTSVTVPASASPGTHTITVVGRHSGTAAQASFLVRTNWAGADDNSGRTGVNPYENTLSPNNVGQLAETWRTTSTGSYYLTGGPIVYNGTVFATFRDYTARAFSLATGAQLWSHTTTDNAAMAPAASSERVFLIDGDDVVALSATTGAVLWTKDLGAEIVADPIVYNTGVYVSAGSSVYDLNTATGSITWSTAVGADAYDPTVSGGRVFVVTDSSYYLTALSATTGGVLWSDPLNRFISASTTVSGGFVYAGLNNGEVIAMRTDNGATVWTYTNPDGTTVEPSAVAGGYLYAGDSSNSLFSLNASTGALRWTVTLPFGTSVDSRPAVADNVVYVDNNQGLFAFTTYGSLLWSYPETGYYYGPAVVDGSVISGTTYDSVVRFTVNGTAAPKVARPDPKSLRPTIGVTSRAG